MSKGEKTRAEIIAAALSMSSKVGLEGLSLGVLADSLGMSKSGLFAHFKSKSDLQMAVLQKAIDEHTKLVVLPALTQAPGEPRVKALFENFLNWLEGEASQGNCFFLALAQEFDDRPGSVHDLLVQFVNDWRKTIVRVVRVAIAESHFREDLDAEQFAFEMVGIGMVYQESFKLLAEPRAGKRARTAFEALLARSRG
jgi:AcrR family transcriptional regulator